MSATIIIIINAIGLNQITEIMKEVVLEMIWLKLEGAGKKRDDWEMDH